MMKPDEIAHWNSELRDKPPLEITRWAISRSGCRAIVSTNFRPYEAVVLHLATQVQPDIPVLWVDHGYNRPATYRHAEQLRALLGLDIRAYLPRVTAAHRDAVDGPIPDTGNEEGLKKFSAKMKLEPFQRGMKELAPTIWITALRKVQNPNRAGTRKKPAPKSASSASETASASGIRKTSGRKSGTSTTPASTRAKTCASSR